MKPEDFQKAVLDWYVLNGRQSLPWHKNPTPYSVWLSEVMLQQTQVSTVIPYFERFIKRFPTIQSLSKSHIDEVMPYWAGLGYYARARNLHKAAQKIVEEFNHQFPDNFEAIVNLPGIGRSTAGAILSFCFNIPTPILDGNVKRVLARFIGLNGWPGEKNNLNTLWKTAEKYTPVKNLNHNLNTLKFYTQSMMDLGAMICTRRNPLCTECPLQLNCISHLKNKTHLIPASKPKINRPIKTAWFLFYIHPNKHLIWLQKRPSKGIWANLYAPLWFETESELKKYIYSQNPNQNLNNLSYFIYDEVIHNFTHYQLRFSPVIIETQTQSDLNNLDYLVKFKYSEINTLALPAPIKKWLINYLKGLFIDL